MRRIDDIDVDQDRLIKRLLSEKTVTDAGCWEWRLNMSKGYGGIHVPSLKKTPRAYRFLYEALVGPVPDGLHLDHVCRNRACINPDHLEPVTLVENVMRGESFSAKNAKKTSCNNGHPYTPENTYVLGDGSRKCKTCSKEKWAARSAITNEKRRAREKAKAAAVREDATAAEQEALDQDHSMAANVLLLQCPECGHELHGTLYAYCTRCKWFDFNASDAADRHHDDITYGAI